MLKLIYGPPGSGKTYYSDSLALEALKNGKKVILLVPEQEAIEAENRIYDRANDANIAIERLSVVSFRRLANLAFRKHGGIEYESIGEGGRLVLLWRSIEELAPLLKCYGARRDRSFVELMLKVCDELKRYCVTGTAISAASDRVSDELFKNKLHDIALIYTFYTAQMQSLYSDSSDDVNRLAEIYRTEKPDSDEVFFIDSFNGFTSPEFNVIESLIKYCDVTVTVNRFRDVGKTGFLTVEKTEKELTELAKKTGVSVEVLNVLGEDDPYSNEEFKLIKSKLYDYAYRSDDSYGSDNVKLAVCKDAFSQAEYIAISICKLIREGARYRDIAVISRSTEKYEGVLDVVFEKYGIPHFLSARSPLTRTALYRAVSSALEVIASGFHTEDVISYIKSGVCGLSLEDIDLIEKYVYLWNIDGKRWTDENDWAMNPNGFTDRKSANESITLDRINSIKRSIILPLTELAEDIKGQSAKDACVALYNFLTKSGISENFKLSTDRSDVTVYNTFIKLIDTLAKIANDIPVNAHMLSSLLYLMAKNTDYGKIPSSFDRVTAGDASIIRCNGIKHVFLTDCESGVFPATVTDDSFFTDKEKESLSELGIKLSPDIKEKNDLEAFYFLRSAGGATDTLTATLCLKDGKAYESIGFQRLCALFPKNEIIKYPSQSSVTDRFQSVGTAKELLAALGNTETGEILKEVFNELGIPTNINSSPISDRSETLSADTVNNLFGNGINMTYSRLESYVKCPFSYFCNYVLKLRPQKYNFFMASDMGSYIHRILEIAIEALFKNNKAADITSEDIERAVDIALNGVLTDILGSDTSNEGKRFEAIIYRLRRTLMLLVTNIALEFKNSLFVPRFFEFPIGNGENEVTPLKFTLDDGTSITVYGTIDRVDTYNKDGNVYVRVVDYKSGSTPHSVSNLKYGLDAQMLLYLFSIWKSNSEKFHKLLGKSENGEIIPSGVLYQTARLKLKQSLTPASSDEVLEHIQASLRRSGVLLNDEEMLEAMEIGLRKRFIPVSRKADGSISASILVSIDGFGDMLKTIDDTFKRIGKKIKNGNACADPLKLTDKDACQYCQLASVCRSKYTQSSDIKSYGGDE